MTVRARLSAPVGHHVPVRVRILLAVLLAAAAAVPAALAAPARPAALPGLMLGRAPWPANNGFQLGRRLQAIGLPALTAEGAAIHIHQHIDLFVKGRAVQVPPGVGIDARGRFISELHTHDGSGIVHVEAPRVARFTLGQLFDVWGLRFTRTCLGGYCEANGNRVWVFVNGKRWQADPRRIPLRAHDEYVIAFGTFRQLPRVIAPAYPFPSGL